MSTKKKPAVTQVKTMPGYANPPTTQMNGGIVTGCCVSGPETPMGDVLGCLNMRIVELVSRAEILIGRLEPVLRQLPPTNAGATAPQSRPVYSEVVDKLHDFAGRLAFTTTRLEGCLDRLEV